MKIGDMVFVHGYVDEIRKDTVIIRNKGGYFGKSNGWCDLMCLHFPEDGFCSKAKPKSK